MLFAYSFLCICLIVLGKKYFKEWINPITMCILPWLCMVIFYEMKWVAYYDLSMKTYIVLLSSIFFYGVGALCGNYLSAKRVTIKRRVEYISRQEYLKRYRKIIIILSVIAAIPATIDIAANIRRYGVFFFTKISTIYAERVLGAFSVDSIPYIGSMLFVSILMAGIYMVQFGFHKTLIWPIVIALIQPLKGGARQSLVQCIILFIIPFLVVKRERKKISSALRKKIMMIFLLLVLFIVLMIVFNQRSVYVNSSEYNSYASDEFSRIIAVIPGAYQLYTYFSSPVGVLNMFLENPEYSFGKNTLFPIYNLLNKFGFNIETERFQKFYRIPISLNVGTAVRELIEDYGMFFGLVMVLICGILVGFIYHRYKKEKSLANTYKICFLYMLVCMSWFMWFLRDANLIIALIVGIFICNSMDAKIIKDSNMGNERNTT